MVELEQGFSSFGNHQDTLGFSIGIIRWIHGFRVSVTEIDFSTYGFKGYLLPESPLPEEFHGHPPIDQSP